MTITILLLEVPKNLAGGFIFPITALLQRPVKGDGPLGAIVNADAAIPAFIRVQDHRGFALFRVRDQDIYLAVIDAGVAAVAFFRIVKDGVAGADNVR